MLGAVCCICGTSVTDNCWCCAACSREYSLNGYATWPEWAKFLRQDEQKRRRRRDHRVQVVALSDLGSEQAGVLERQWYGDAED